MRKIPSLGKKNKQTNDFFFFLSSKGKKAKISANTFNLQQREKVHSVTV
jgi:hypothetical protein